MSLDALDLLPTGKITDPAGLAVLFADEGTADQATGLTPLPLLGRDAVWMTTGGNAEVFATELDAEANPTGPRRHVASVPAGELCFGFQSPPDAGQGLVAVAGAGAVLRRLTLRRLREAVGAQPAAFAALVEKVERWVQALSHAVTHEARPRPTMDARLPLQGAFTLQAGERTTAPEGGIAWLDVGRVDTLFSGLVSTTAHPHGAVTLLPLTPDTWVQADREDLTGTCPTTDALRQPAGWMGLDLFHDAVFRCETLNRRIATAEQHYRLNERVKYRDAARNAAMQDIASVIDARAGDEGRIQLDPALMGEPFFAACSLVGQARGIVIRQHPETVLNPELKDQLSVIAKASNCRVRPVRLRGQWWEHDQEPMLASIREGAVPVALLPRGKKAYDMVNPAEGSRVDVNAEVAATLAPFGVCFYRPLPPGPLRARDLLRMGLQGLRSDLWMVLGMTLFTGLLTTLTPYLTGIVFDTVIPGAEHGSLFEITMALFFAALGAGAFDLAKAFAILRVESRMDYGLQAGIWDRLLTLPPNFFRRFSAGDLADRAGGIDAIRTTISGVGAAALLGSLVSMFQLALLYYYSARLALVATAFVLLAGGIIVGLNLWQLKYQRRQLNLRGKITGFVLQLITGVSKLRVAHAEDHALRAWARDFSQQKRLTFLAGRISNMVEVFSTGAPVLGGLVMFFMYVYYQGDTPPGTPASGGTGSSLGISTGGFIAFYAAFGAFLEATLALGRASVDMMTIFPTYERLRPIIEAPAELEERRTYPGQLAGEIEVSHLSFRHLAEGPPTLADINLHIHPGEFVAIVGPSGSGKSTLMRLLLGFEKPESGTLYYDGQDLANLDLREVRQQIGVVLQSSRLLPGDIFRNIVGNSLLTVEDAWEAAKLAGLEDDINAMPMGMHTVISEGGGTFSGGQAQRLMIARAIARRPRILFFDEATSALDNRTQRQVSEGLEQLKATRIVVAHRLSTIINADNIFVLEGGRLVQSGKYAALMEQPGLFRELARRQLA